MQETTEQPTLAPEAPDGLAASALQAEAWAGEPFLHPDEDPAVALAPETARRRALDDALAEIEAGAREPSYEWKIRYALMLGLERVLSQSPPKLASGTELRRHQIDALAGMLTELIAATQVEPENGNGENGHEAEPEEDEEDLGVHLEERSDEAPDLHRCPDERPQGIRQPVERREDPDLDVGDLVGRGDHDPAPGEQRGAADRGRDVTALHVATCGR